MSRRRHIVAGVAATITLLSTTLAAGQTRPDPSRDSDLAAAPPQHRVSGALDLLERVATDGRPDPIFEGIDGHRRVRVTIRSDCRAGDRRLRSELVRWQALDTLESRSCVDRVEPAWMPGTMRPLEVTTRRVGAVRAHLHTAGQVDGEGVTIALLDSPVDILHPAFFRPDGGRYRWIDVDGDGSFRAGTDAVDLNENGRADHNEILRTVVARTKGGDDDPGRFRPRRDWLYADMNDNEERDAGPADGFREFDPAYAEPTFVAEDVNRNGRLDRHEALYRLDTSKIARVVQSDEEFVRGENLVAAAEGDLPGRAAHGTAVAGILVGGQLGFQTRVGVAPRADVVVIGKKRELHDGGAGQLAAVQRSRELGADIFLSQWTNPFTRPLDGSTNVERAMAEAREAGVSQVVPVGNLNDSKKHLELQVDADSSTTARFRIPSGLRVNGEPVDVESVFGSLQWRSSDTLSVALRPPDRAKKELADSGQTTEFRGLDVRAARDRTPNGTAVVTFYITGRDGGDPAPLPEGEWSFTLSGASSATTLYGRVTDARTGWGVGVRWSSPTRDRRTVSYPATGSAALSVAAHAGRKPTGDDAIEPGQLRPFSGRGPSLDGRRVVDIAAPDNPFVPAASDRSNKRPAAYRQFGGTSGAAPHVAGALALLEELAPEATPAQLEGRLTGATDTTNLVPPPASLPNRSWGAGRLDAYRALYDAPRPDTRPPDAQLAARRNDDAFVLDASGSRDADGDELSFRFDVEYDGRWDTDWRSNPTAEVDATEISDAPESRPRVGRVEVRDEHGARSGALALLPERPDTNGDAGVVDSRDGPAPETADDGPDDDPGSPLFQCTIPRHPKYPPLSGLLVLASLVVWRRPDRRH